MHISKYLIVVFIMLAPSAVFSEDLGLMRLSLIQGNVQVITQDNGDWTSASINMPLNEGDRLWVPEDGRLEIQVSGGSTYARTNRHRSISSPWATMPCSSMRTAAISISTTGAGASRPSK